MIFHGQFRNLDIVVVSLMAIGVAVLLNRYQPWLKTKTRALAFYDKVKH